MSGGIEAALRSIVSGPGTDTRQWVSYGIVDPGEKSVIFTDENGDPSPIGPIVVVTLQPSGITVPCRVSSSCAGNAEGEWFPFMAGDECIVVVPEGNEQAGCVIVGRMNQSIDKFPLTVAGMDVTKNTIAFKRLRTPYVIETASSFMIRSALTGAGLTLDATGNMFLVSGDGHQLVLHGSFLKLAAKGGVDFIQVDPGEHEVLMSAGETTQFVLGKTKSAFFSEGTLNLGVAGMAGLGHAMALEQVIVFVQAVLTGLGLIGGPLAVITPAIPGLMNAAIALAGTLPIAPMQAAMLGALAIPADPTGAIPGVGRAGLML